MNLFIFIFSFRPPLVPSLNKEGIKGRFPPALKRRRINQPIAPPFVSNNFIIDFLVNMTKVKTPSIVWYGIPMQFSAAITVQNVFERRCSSLFAAIKFNTTKMAETAKIPKPNIAKNHSIGGWDVCLCLSIIPMKIPINIYIKPNKEYRMITPADIL